MVEEKRKPIEGYEELYDVTESGKIYSYSKKGFKVFHDEYGFRVVRLFKNGIPTDHEVFELWKMAFPDLPESAFKGIRKRIY